MEKMSIGIYSNSAKYSIPSDSSERKIQRRYWKCIDMEMKLY